MVADGSRLRKELFAWTDSKIAVQFWYEFFDEKEQSWYRCYGLGEYNFPFACPFFPAMHSMHLLVVIFVQMEANPIFRSPPHTHAYNPPLPASLNSLHYSTRRSMVRLPCPWFVRNVNGTNRPVRDMPFSIVKRTGHTTTMVRCASAR